MINDLRFVNSRVYSSRRTDYESYVTYNATRVIPLKSTSKNMYLGNYDTYLSRTIYLCTIIYVEIPTSFILIFSKIDRSDL